MTFVILVVDDNEMNREVLARRLMARNYQVLLACDGADAIELAFREQPALILMDMRMPVMDGWTAARKLKEQPGTQHIPVIGVSANGMQEDKDQALAAGCVAYETKPINFDRLLSLIETFCQKAS